MKTPSRPLTRVMTSLDSALYSLCSLLFKGLWLHPALCALCVLLWQSSSAAVHYVDLSSTNSTPPYTDWATAATNIQDAVDAAAAGDEVVVTNGIYACGGRAVAFDFTANRVVVDKPLNVRSINGPLLTAIDGGHSNRCVYLIDGATLSGFTLSNGVSHDGPSAGVAGGGGVWCASSNAVVSNCVITRNQAWATFDFDDACGGGAYGGTLNDCTLTGNSVGWIDSDSWGGDALTACGGGAAYCTLNHCIVSHNSVVIFFRWNVASASGGGAAWCTLKNCTVASNLATADVSFSTAYRVSGGGTAQCTLNNCVVVGNSATGFGGCTLGECKVVTGGGTYGGPLHNSILFGNTCQGVCEDCGAPGRLAWDNWFGDPLFADKNGWANLRLQSNSPCINAGNNAYAPAGPDLDGNPRIAGGTVDIGAYEFQSPVSQTSYAWLQQYGLPINSSTDSADPDGDAVDNYHEWLAGTDPTNPLSSPAQLSITPSGTNVLVTWSTNAVGFTLQSTPNLDSPTAWSTNSHNAIVIGGQNVITNRVSAPRQFYRLVH